jgi:hypothetical protein
MTVVVVHDEHVGVSAGGRLDEPPGEVGENLTRWRGTIGVDVASMSGRRRGDGWREVGVVGRECGVDGGQRRAGGAGAVGSGDECRDGGFGGRFGGVEVRALLIEVTLNHGDRGRRAAANLSRGEGGQVVKWPASMARHHVDKTGEKREP